MEFLAVATPMIKTTGPLDLDLPGLSGTVEPRFSVLVMESIMINPHWLQGRDCTLTLLTLISSFTFHFPDFR
jgi:hypothetical protein